MSTEEVDRMFDALEEMILKPAERVRWKPIIQQFVERLRGRLEGRRAMNNRSLEGHDVQACGVETRNTLLGRCNGIELALMDLEYVAKEFGIGTKEGEGA